MMPEITKPLVMMMMLEMMKALGMAIVMMMPEITKPMVIMMMLGITRPLETTMMPEIMRRLVKLQRTHLLGVMMLLKMMTRTHHTKDPLLMEAIWKALWITTTIWAKMMPEMMRRITMPLGITIMLETMKAMTMIRVTLIWNLKMEKAQAKKRPLLAMEKLDLVLERMGTDEANNAAATIKTPAAGTKAKAAPKATAAKAVNNDAGNNEGNDDDLGNEAKQALE